MTEQTSVPTYTQGLIQEEINKRFEALSPLWDEAKEQESGIATDSYPYLMLCKARSLVAHLRDDVIIVYRHNQKYNPNLNLPSEHALVHKTLTEVDELIAEIKQALKLTPTV